MNGILEIYTNKVWMIQPSFVHGILPTLMYNSQNHTTLGIDREKKVPQAINASGTDIFREYEVTEDGQVLPVYDGWNGIDYLKQLKEPFINVIPVDGPITRNGGACSYGSKEIRDWMMKASENKYCRGHILVINTNGGSAWAKNDFQQGIDYAHANGQRVFAQIDGLCASAGMYLASLCDEVYVMNLKDQLGCVGVMAAFFTQKNGEKNQYTGETYREYYDPESVDKNKEFRDIAEDEDATLLIEELTKLGVEFRADMKAAFPKADVETHLKGKMFNADEVMGILCDGQMMLGDLVTRAFAVADGKQQPIERTKGRKIAKAPKATATPSNAPSETKIVSPNNNSINMKENYPAVFALLGVEEMQVSEEGTFFNKDLLATLNAAIEAKNQEIADAKKLADDLTAEKDNLTAQIENIKTENAQAVENLNAEHQKAIDDLNAKIADQEQDITAKEETIGNLQNDMECKQKELEQKEIDFKAKETELNGVKESLTTAENTIAERDQQISDLNAQVEELQNGAGAAPAAGAAPKDNGQGGAVPEIAVSGYVYDPSLSYQENMRLKDEHEKAQAK